MCLQEEYGAALSFAKPPKAYEVLARGYTVGCAQSVIELINAVANYWKHQEDWPTKEEANSGWVRTVWNVQSNHLRNHERRTIEVVASIGMTAGCTGNLRTAAKILGVTNYADLSPIREMLQVWAAELLEATRLEISQRRGTDTKDVTSG
jgi:hypothetical protein